MRSMLTSASVKCRKVPTGYVFLRKWTNNYTVDFVHLVTEMLKTCDGQFDFYWT